jgi:hypothetical protein
MRQILIEKCIPNTEIYQWVVRYDVYKTEFWRNETGELHSILCHPAVIRYCNGQIYSKDWFKKGEHHRIKHPAIIIYENEKIIEQQWYNNGEFIKNE